MRILVVHEVNYLSKIIYEFQILPEILSMLGHDVTVVDYDDSWPRTPNAASMTFRTRVYAQVHRAYPQASVTVRRPGMLRFPALSRVSGAVASGLEVARVLRSRAADVILLYGLPTVGLQTLLAARSFRVPIIFRAIDVSHQLVPYRLLVPATRILEKCIFNRVDFNIALTPHLREYIRSYGVADSRIRLLPSGVDVAMFSPGCRDAKLLACWGIGPEDRVILFMGTVYRFSGLDRVISDFPKLMARHPKAKLLIVGDGEDLIRLKSMASDAGVAEHVIFTGRQPYAALPAIIRSSDVCINPFELNGVTRNILPTKLFQYMACGKSVVATPLPGTVPFLAGEEAGVIYAPLADFVDQLAEMLSDSERRERVERMGLETAARYDWTAIARQLATWMSDVASSSSRSRTRGAHPWRRL